MGYNIFQKLSDNVSALEIALKLKKGDVLNLEELSAQPA